MQLNWQSPCLPSRPLRVRVSPSALGQPVPVARVDQWQSADPEGRIRRFGSDRGLSTHPYCGPRATCRVIRPFPGLVCWQGPPGSDPGLASKVRFLPRELLLAADVKRHRHRGEGVGAAGGACGLSTSSPARRPRPARRCSTGATRRPRPGCSRSGRGGRNGSLSRLDCVRRRHGWWCVTAGFRFVHARVAQWWSAPFVRARSWVQSPSWALPRPQCRCGSWGGSSDGRAVDRKSTGRRFDHFPSHQSLWM